MRDCEKGIQRIEIPLSEYIFERIYRADSEDEMFRTLSTQYTGLPRFDSRDVMGLDWAEASSELQREGFIAVAVLRVARGHRLAAEFILEHVDHHDIDAYTHDGDILLACTECDDEMRLEPRSLRPLHMDPDEPHHLDALRDLKEDD